MKKKLGILVCIAVLLLSSCGEPEATATPTAGVISNAEELVGVWHRTTRTGFGGEVYRQYTADGTYQMGSSLEELDTQPRVEGEFRFEGEQMVMRDVTALPGYDVCLQAGQVGRYTVERLANGHIRFVTVEDDCSDRAGMLGTGEMEPVR